MNHLGGIHILVELFFRAQTQFQSRLLQTQVFSVSVLSNLRSVVVTNERGEGGHEHQGALHQFVDLRFVSLNTSDAALIKRIHHVAQEANTLNQVISDHRLKDVQFKVTLASGEVNGGGVTHHLNSDHRHGFTLGGVDLTRHDGATRFVSRNNDFAQTAARARSEPTDVVSNLHQISSQGSKSTFKGDDRVVARQTVELVGAINKAMLCAFGQKSGNLFAKAFRRVDTGTDSRPANGEFTAAIQVGGDQLQAMVKHGGVAREFLAEGQRRGVLQVRTTIFDDVGKFFRLTVKRCLQLLEGREEMFFRFNHGHQMKSGRERVVRGLRHIDVIVRMHEVFFRDFSLVAEVTVDDFGGAIGDHFVHVHIGLRARARLPNGEREVAAELTLKNVLTGLSDGLVATFIELTKGEVRRSASLLQVGESLGDFLRHLFNTDREVVVTTLRLSTPVLGVVDFHFAHGVFFDTNFLHGFLLKKNEYHLENVKAL